MTPPTVPVPRRSGRAPMSVCVAFRVGRPTGICTQTWGARRPRLCRVSGGPAHRNLHTNGWSWRPDWVHPVGGGVGRPRFGRCPSSQTDTVASTRPPAVAPGNVAVITGGASGIGLAVAEALIAEGMSVVLADIDAPKLRDVEARLSEDGAASPRWCATPRSRPRSTRSSSTPSTVRRCPRDVQQRRHRRCRRRLDRSGRSLEAGARRQRARRGVRHPGGAAGHAGAGIGHIVSTASHAGLNGAPGIAPYVASKHAVVGLSESLFLELELMGSPVGASVLCPEFVKTDLMGKEPDAVESPMAQLINQALVAGVAAGSPRARWAPPSSPAIKADRFWILTHDSTREASVARVQRAPTVSTRRSPFRRADGPRWAPRPRRSASASASRTTRPTSTRASRRPRSATTTPSANPANSTSSTSATPATCRRCPMRRWRSWSRRRPTSPARSTRQRSARATFPATTSTTWRCCATCSPSACARSSPAAGSPSTSPTSVGARTAASPPTSPRSCRTTSACCCAARWSGRSNAVPADRAPGARTSRRRTRCCATRPSG
jgi:NAD(P)-dependent dehydrogenase (short-subunit alcohol dehydrogenase family)